VGRDGAGKSAVTVGFAQKIVAGKVPAVLKDARVIRLKLKEMKATSGLGASSDRRTGQPGTVDQFNDRLYYILSKVTEHNAKGGKQIVLNIDSLGDLAGRRDILAAAMSGDPGLRLIGEVSDQKFTQFETDAKDVISKFHKITISPLDAAQTETLLKTKAAELEKATGVATPADLFEKIYKMSTRYLTATAQPESALHALETAVAYAQIDGVKTLGENQVVGVISNLTGVPKEFIGSSMSERIKTLGDELPKKVLGQDKALKEIVASLKIANANMQDPNKPLGSFLMIGPTGVGKTETAKALAEHLGVPLITEDMSNYQDQHAKAKLVGSPPGYVGFDKEAALEKVAKSPYCILLLDEIEKAHTDVFNTFLSVLDEGRLQLMNGKTVDFKNCIVLMTSNLGAKDAERARDRQAIGFNQAAAGDGAADSAYRQAIQEKLPPEFINRLDSILQFDRLSEQVVRKIAASKVKQVSAFLTDKNRNLKLELSPEATAELFKLGYDPKYGARPMDRAVKKYIKQPLADWFIENGASITEPSTLYVKGLKNGFETETRKQKQTPGPKPN
jgi:ATP-dependent Clp protease ATP-binding subunit ClpA